MNIGRGLSQSSGQSQAPSLPRSSRGGQGEGQSWPRIPGIFRDEQMKKTRQDGVSCPMAEVKPSREATSKYREQIRVLRRDSVRPDGAQLCRELS